MNEFYELLTNIGNEYGIFAVLATIGITGFVIIKTIRLIVEKFMDNTRGL